jgi:hypothetical protein
VELFGAESGIFVAIACVMSYLFSGHTGIYGAQRIGTSKYHFMPLEKGLTLTTHAEETAKTPAEKVSQEIHLSNDLHSGDYLQPGEDIEMNDEDA